LIRRLEDHYHRDVHAMLRLPAPTIEVTAGCNFAIAQVLLSVVSGASTTLYAHSGGTGKRFKGLLVDYYPWAEEPTAERNDEEHARHIYSLFRNPLAHDLGLDLERRKRTGKIIVKRLTTDNGRQGHSEAGVEALEHATRPARLSPVLRNDAGRVVLMVEAFYWGVRTMLVRLNADRSRMATAEAFLASLGGREA
jgi:hypothetical protein